ncbi:2-amino-4-hydroxy-6-hydroxymethyldihydropteridine diphosphokinase [Candidatus Peregrinibacteria bacterium]|nr:2-amino-4-hydroxy-6-hydroxymethyldihydropteridine diphosphokinase [Candidatus Peregrinibacteria bacterium]
MVNNTAYLCLGSNIGNRQKNLKIAIESIKEFANIIKESSIYETEPEDYKNQPNFLNIVLLIKTDLSPSELIIKTQEIEHVMGRKKEIEKGPRNIDIDIVFYNNEIIEQENLHIPHQNFSKRNFVLTPMAEIAPKYIDPISHKTVSELKKSLTKPSKVTLWT